jgi:hypothetical protein
MQGNAAAYTTNNSMNVLAEVFGEQVISCGLSAYLIQVLMTFIYGAC